MVLRAIENPLGVGVLVGIVAGIVWVASAFATRHAASDEARRAYGALRARFSR